MYKEGKCQEFTICGNYAILSVVHNVFKGSTLLHQSQYCAIWGKPNQTYRDDRPALAQEQKERRMTHKVDITQQC